jgi:hypothetical protein
MRIVSLTRAAVYAAAATAMLMAVLPGQASAGFFDFFNRSTQATTGKQLVIFTPKADPGTIIVSFADRRLYFVLALVRPTPAA